MRGDAVVVHKQRIIKVHINMQEGAVMYALQVLAEKILAGLLVTPAWDLN